MIPYLIWSAVSLAANLVQKLMLGQDLLEGLGSEFVDIFIRARSVWFLIVMFYSELLCIAISFLTDKVRVNFYVLLTGVWFAVSVSPLPDLLSLHSFKWLFPFLILGMVCEERGISGKVRRISVWLAGFLFVGGGLLLYQTDYFHEYMSFGYSSFKSVLMGIAYYIISALAVCFVMCIAVRLERTRVGQYIAMAGFYSLEIYVTHMLLVKFLLIVPPVILKNDVCTYVYFIIYAAAIISVITLISKYLISRNKIMRFTVGK